MRRWQLVVALAVCTGCSTILGFKDGTPANGREGSPCDTRKAPSDTGCEVGYVCSIAGCAKECHGDFECNSGTVCTGRAPTSDGGAASGGSGVPAGSFCLPQEGAMCGPTTGCPMGQVCVAAEHVCRIMCGNNGGICPAAQKCVDGACHPETAPVGDVIGTFGGGNVNGLATLNDNVYFTIDGKLRRCSKTKGCTKPPEDLEAGGTSLGTLVRFNSASLAWTSTNKITTCLVDRPDKCRGTSSSAERGLVAALAESPTSAGVFWLGLPALVTDGGAQPDGGFDLFQWAGPVSDHEIASVGHTNGPAALAAVDETHFFAVVEGHLLAIAAGGTAQPVTIDEAHRNNGAPAVTIANGMTKRAIWTLESASSHGLHQCEIDLSRPTLCSIGALSHFADTPQQAVITAVTYASGAVYWTEFEQAPGTTRIMSCIPGSPGTTLVGPRACDQTQIKTKATVPARVLFVYPDGPFLYMLTNDTHALPGTTDRFALRKTAL